MPQLLPEDIADAVIYAIGTPPRVQVNLSLLSKITKIFDYRDF